MRTDTSSRNPRSPRGKSRGLTGLGLGILCLWILTYVILPAGQKLPLAKPVMDVLIAEQVNSSAYWYTQSEETAVGAMYVKNTLASLEKRN